MRSWLVFRAREWLMRVSGMPPDLEQLRDAIERVIERVRADIEPMRADLVALRVALRRQSVATLLILWADGTKPRAVSRTLHVDSSLADQSAACYFQHPIPAGAWLVAHGCELRAVHTGQDAEDLGPMPRGKLVVLSSGIALGQQLSVVFALER